MTTAVIQPAFSAGELSPSLYGRVDLSKYHTGATTMRNMFANYRGGASSRAGLAFVGQSKQPGTSAPPRDIPFQFSVLQGYALEFGDNYMCVKVDGAYVTETPINITGATNTSPCVLTVPAHGYSNNDWVFIANIGGMTQLDNLTCIVQNVTTNTFSLASTLTGLPIDATSFGVYTSGGTVARIYTLVTPYAAVDLPYMKYTQSADVMSLTLVNQETLTEYPPYDLARIAADNWTLTLVNFASVAVAPGSVTAGATVTTTSNPTQYEYVVTSIDSLTGQESIASPIALVTNSVDIAQTQGSINIFWTTVNGASSYNIYKAPEAYDTTVPVGSIFSFAGTAVGNTFVDNNITPDFTTVPPQHKNPFARGQIISVTMTAGGSGYSQATVGVVIGTSTGSGAHLIPVVVSGSVTSVIVDIAGGGYANTDTISITGGTGATATLVFGPQTGTYPGCVAYFQQRRLYANTLNNPDTYYGSQPGAFKNMDSSIPAIDSDAIIGTPWAQQVNGIQAMVPMPGGLVILTGLGAWQLSGGAQQAAVTPADQVAQPQAYNGCSPTVQPIPINFDILYVQQRGSIVRDLSYNFFANIYTGTDMTVLSNHLFQNHLILQWGWAEEPYKIIWCIRDDGVLLSFTFLKEQDIYAWARHDTNGLFVSVCVISEPPVNAPYFIVKRYIEGIWVYYSERMDNRLWTSVEDTWCVDAGLSYPLSSPNATLTATLETGSDFGPDFGPDFGGSGSTVLFDASAPVFNSGMVGDVIRMAGGIATITTVVDTEHVYATLTTPFADVIQNSPITIVVPALSGDWTLGTPVTAVSGLNHLEGMTVAILADGSVVPNQVVTDGAITLPEPATAILVGLPFQAQLQTMYLDTGMPTSQGKRKQITAATVRIEASRGIKVGTNQPDSATQPNNAVVPWGSGSYSQMTEVKERTPQVPLGSAIPLFTGDERVQVQSTWQKNGQVAIQQDYPLPANILAVIPEVNIGDDNG